MPLRGPRKKRRRVSPSLKSRSGTVSEDEKMDWGHVGVRVESAVGAASDDEEDARMRGDNAYPGATNSIGSVHQRRWYLSLDKRNSGFVKAGGDGIWRRGDGDVGGFEAFFVRGPEVERSLVTGRLSEKVMKDEGVEGFVARKMWRPVLE